MKKLQYIIFLVLAGVLVFSCKPEPAVTSIDPSLGYSVYFPSVNASFLEGDTTVISITVNADAARRTGSTVSFTVIPPEANLDRPGWTDYKVLTTDNEVLATNVVTFNDGSAVFKFTTPRASDPVDDDPGGSRIFKIAVSGNSANLPLGQPTGAKMDTVTVTVKNRGNPIFMDELVGSWNVDEYVTNAAGNAYKRIQYDITVAQIGTTDSVTITGLYQGLPNRAVKAKVNLEAKTFVIPYQVLPTINPSYQTIVTNTKRYYLGITSTENSIASISKSKTGLISIYWDDVEEEEGTGYGIAAANLTTGALMGFFSSSAGDITYATVVAYWEKLP